MSGYAELAKKMEALAKVPEKVAAGTRDRVEGLMQAEFSGGRDAYGRPWKPLKSGGAATLQRTGAMRNSLKVTADGTKVNVTVDYPVVFHQGGTKYMPARPVLTVGVFPPSWSEAIEASFADAMKEAM